ncbi:MAG TPA: hypothetical protein PKX48_07900 [Planctomycetota bacterium]|jgi:hypothetical protein|nr:hypothetical protein [Planctomycetota bacterium]OQC21194.1 MAG: hypothetical protein BWX69_01171 [Planctomycetes bacterium ADurb.Bin069]HNR99129.1 hypothetical protein [Planctomycetota bacterium]HNU25834.1 hypothetical protein [Planctomycetota bacterium]HOE29786.1 hypothetical protein [Planctomycetota bacterium]
MRSAPRPAPSALLLLACAAFPHRAAAFEVELEARQVERYAKIEITWAPPASYAGPGGAARADAWAEIAAPDGAVLKAPAFWFQPCEEQRIEAGGRSVDWIYPSGPCVWKVRFTPTAVGEHSGVFVVDDRGGPRRSAPFRFECTPSARPGFLRAARGDGRYLERTSGEPFFAIGQNVAFLGGSQYVNGTAKLEKIFAAIAGAGGNFVRLWAGCEDWAMAIEARKSPWGRSWSWKPPFAPMPSGGEAPGAKCIALGSKPGDSATAAPPRPLAVKPGTAYTLSGRLFATGPAAVAIDVGGGAPVAPIAWDGRGVWEPFARRVEIGGGRRWLDRIALRLQAAGGPVFLRGLSLREAAGGPELLPQAEADAPVEGSYDQVDARFLDRVVAAAEAHGIALQVAFVTRDLYLARLSKEDSPEYAAAIAAIKNLARYFVARWGYSTAIAAWEYWNEMDPGKPLDRFYRELRAHFDAIDPYGHLVATSAWAPCPRDWAHPALDTADLHFYLRPALGDAFKDAAATVAERAAFLRSHAPGKPAFLSEFGLAGDKWELSDYMRRDQDYLHGRDALWAAAMAGLAGGSMSWWWEDFDRMNLYRHYAPLAAFVADIPFPSSGFTPVAWRERDPALHAMALRGPRLTCVWLSDPAASWWNVVVEGRAPARIANAAFAVPDLPEGRYRIEWWDTGAGKPIRAETRMLAKGERVQVPPFRRDIACKLAREPEAR